MKFKYFYLSIFIVFTHYSCKKPDQFPDEPIISYKNMYTILNNNGYNEKVTIQINFTDGDGDVGYKAEGQNDSIFDSPLSPYYKNFNANLFRLINGNWVENISITRLGGRLPYLTPGGKNKSLKGEIAGDIYLPVFSPSPAVKDTFRFDVYIYDRSFHKSNVISTPNIILNIR